MKNRKTVVVAFMLAAVMLLGVGYAALTTTLTISGEADVGTGSSNAEFAGDVYFKSATATNTAKGDTASIATNNTSKATFTVKSLALSGESATFTFVVANESNHDAKISVKSIAIHDTIEDGADTDDNDEIFLVTTDWGSDVKTLAKASDPNDATNTAGTATIIVTVQLNPAKNNPTNPVKGIFDIILNVETVN